MNPKKRRQNEEDAASELLAWYDRERRILPWREDPTPYHVWLSEIMLQQTRVEAAKGYYERFLSVLPDIAALAAADEETLLKLWEGLGYYSRVRNLHKAAVQIMEEYQGVMPGTAGELRHLAGVGPYTAAAIASIAFGQPAPAVDGNFLRVFARMTQYGENIKTDAAKKAAETYFTERISRERPGDYNQAVMDLGATICLPNGEPLCEQCPWNGRCLAHTKTPGEEVTLPVVPKKRQRPVEKMTVFLIHPETGNGHCRNMTGEGEPGKEPTVLIRKRPGTGLLAGLWEFPNTEGWLKPGETRAYLETLGFDGAMIREIRPLPPAKHIFTHKEWRMHGYEVWIDEFRQSSIRPAGDISAVEKSAENENIANHPERRSKMAADSEWKEAEGGTGNVSASLRELVEDYSIPSAFAAYERLLFADHTILLP